MKKLLLILPFIATLSCTRDDIQESNLNMLAAGKWFLSGVITNIPIETGDSLRGDTLPINIFDLKICPECLKDDEIEISSNGGYEISLGEVRCDNDTQIFKFPHNGTWQFNRDEDGIILNPGTNDSITMDITTLTESELQLTYYDTIPQMLFKNDSAIHPITILYRH